MPLTYRFNTVQTLTGSYLAPASGVTVNAFEPGAIASAGSSGTTITVHAGHGFAANDYLVVGTDTAKYRLVQSTTATTVVVDSAVTVSSGDVIINLGADTGGSSPDFLGSGRTIYSDPTGSTTVTNSALTPNSQGEYSYWTKYSCWEVIRSGSTILDVVQEAVPQRLALTTSPTATDYPLANVDDVAFKLFRTGDTNPLLSFSALPVDNTYAMLLRVGDRAQTTGDSRVLGYFSSTIASPGAVESQALYGINVYTGAGTASQIGVHGIGQSLPGNGNTLSGVNGVQGVSSHLDTAGGTTTTLTGVNGTAQTGSGASYTGTAQNMFGVRGNAQHRSTNVTTTQMFGVYGLCSDVAASGVTTAAGARFDQPSNATNNHCAVLYGTPLASLAFTDDLSNFRYIRWSNSNTRFEVSSNTRVTGTLNSTGALTVEATSNAIIVGAGTDADINLRFNASTADADFSYLGASAVNEFKLTKALRVTGEVRAGGDSAGVASHTSLTNTADVTANSSGTGTIKFKGATSRDSSGFIKIYVGTTAYYVPIFSAITG